MCRSPNCCPAGPRASSAPTTPRACSPRYVRALTGARTRRRLAIEIVAEIRHLDRRIASIAKDIAAPIEVSSGDVVRHRLSRAGGRNCFLRTLADTQIRYDLLLVGVAFAVLVLAF